MGLNVFNYVTKLTSIYNSACTWYTIELVFWTTEL